MVVARHKEPDFSMPAPAPGGFVARRSKRNRFACFRASVTVQVSRRTETARKGELAPFPAAVRCAVLQGGWDIPLERVRASLVCLALALIALSLSGCKDKPTVKECRAACKRHVKLVTVDLDRRIKKANTKDPAVKLSNRTWKARKQKDTFDYCLTACKDSGTKAMVKCIERAPDRAASEKCLAHK